MGTSEKYTERNCFSLEEFCFRNGIGRTTAYKEIKEGRLHASMLGLIRAFTLFAISFASVGF